MTAQKSSGPTASTPLASTDVIILAGGLGSRLSPVFPGKPKILAPLAGRPILDHLLDRLQQQGAGRVIMALGHLADQVCRHIKNGADGLDLVASIEPEPLGTAGAIAHALPRVHSDHVVVMNGDSLIDDDLGAFVSWAKTKLPGSALVATSVGEASRYGVLSLGHNDVIEAFNEKPDTCGQAWINAGVYYFDSLALGLIASIGRGSLEHDVFPQLPAGHLRAYRSSARFIDIGTPESFVNAAQWPSRMTEGSGEART